MARARAILAGIAQEIGVKLSDESLTKLLASQKSRLADLEFAVLLEVQRAYVPTPEDIVAQEMAFRRRRKVLMARHRAELAALRALAAPAIGGSAPDTACPDVAPSAKSPDGPSGGSQLPPDQSTASDQCGNPR